MRVTRLDLVRYGRFTDASLGFGAERPGKPDLHIVYGDNEAGKTTTWSALLDLLFGIEPHTPYKFLHPAAALRLGGAIDIGHGTHEVTRPFKAPGLLDADGRPLPEGLFSADFAGLDRDTYRSMFSLDEKTLVAGGESILASKGHIGELLFSATAGLVDFSRALTDLRTETDLFYKVHGRKHQLADFKKQLLELRDRKAAIDVLATPFAKLLASRATAEATYAAAAAERARLRAELGEVQRHIAVLPRLSERRLLRTEHDALPDTPAAPSGWIEDLPELRREEVALATQRTAFGEQVARLSEDIAALPIDGEALATAPRVKRAAELRARHLTAAKDLPDRQAALANTTETTRRILTALGQATCKQPAALLLPSDIVDDLRRHIERASETTTNLKAASTESRAAEARLVAAEAALKTAPAPLEPATLSELVSVVDAAQRDTSDARHLIAERACAAAHELVTARLAALAPWKGGLAELAQVRVCEKPDRDRLAAALTSARAEVVRRADDRTRLEVDVERLVADARTLKVGGALVDDVAAAESRRTRDAAWALHRQTLDPTSADAFVDRLQADDAICLVRLGQTGALADLRGVERQMAKAEVDLHHAHRQATFAEARVAGVLETISSRLGHIAFVDGETALEALEAFATGRERALEAGARLQEAEKDRADAAADRMRIETRLRRILVKAGEDGDRFSPLETLIATGRAVIERQTQAQAALAHVESCRRELGERRRQLGFAQEVHDAWHETWRASCEATWFGGEVEVAHVRRTLAHLADLGVAIERHEGLADRIAKMTSDQAAFATEVAEMASLLGLEAVDGDVVLLTDRIERHIAAATLTAATRTAKTAEKADALARLRRCENALTVVMRRTDEMTGHYGVTSLAEVEQAIRSALRKAELALRLRALDLEITTACGAPSVDAATAALGAHDKASLERSRVDLEAQCADQDERTQALFAALGRTRDALEAVGGDEAAARLEEERRTVLLEIEDRTLAHLNMRAGIIAAEQAVSLYRDRHRSSMMTEASDLFRALTRGAYSGLATQNTRDAEVLVGLPAGGGSKLATEMSTGTRSQLYLALRIAGYREFVKNRRPVPFVLDDILETFDDGRAEASLTLLAEMARTGQVIYLTHHRHLCDIARRVCPDASLHDLGTLQ